jgi:cyclopropane fatty-acyl-phospholipid synthase-like methyltransferase
MMHTVNRISDQFLITAVQAGLYGNEGNLRYHFATVFEGIALQGARFLDIGGGSGLHSLYAAACGACEAVCLEPEAAGSTAHVNQHFGEICASLGVTTARLVRETLQSYVAPGRPFDVVLLHDSINHIDEQACITLLESPASREAYRRIFEKLAGLTSRGATLIICDCSRYNLFPRCGRRNPFMPTIEWHKHQAPEVWAALLGEAGFTCPRIQWPSFNTLRGVGRILLGHRVPAYFLTSCFRLTARKAHNANSDAGI